MSRATFPPPAVAAAAALALHAALGMAIDAATQQAPVQAAATPAATPRPAGVQTRTLQPAPTAVAAVAPRPAMRPRPVAEKATAPAASAGPAAPGPGALPAPPVTWQYRLQHGEASGLALLRWQPTPPQYVALLERQLDGRPALPGWHSRGQLDDQGLAPERYAEQRQGRDRRATNFRRAEGLLSYSASTEQQPLPAGVQDRLSWMLQLAALLAANPALREPGAQIALPVAGLRGAVGLWLFEQQGPQDLQLPIGPVPATLRLQRAALGPYEGVLEVWLDPARHYLPVRLRQGLTDSEGARWEMLLESELAQP